MSVMDDVLEIGDEISEQIPPVEPQDVTLLKMSKKVIIKRYPDEYTMVGPPTLVKDLDEAAEILAANPWMRLWLASKVKEALLTGEIFNYYKRVSLSWKGRADGLVSEYKLATEEEVLNYVDTAAFVSATGHSISKRAQEKGYVLHYHEGAKLIEAYDNLPRQAKVILDLLNETGRENLTEASIQVILSDKSAELKTKQDPMKIFTFYRKRLIDEGHLEEVDNEED